MRIEKEKLKGKKKEPHIEEKKLIQISKSNHE